MRTLYIISDLHLGGRPHDIVRGDVTLPGYQINHAYAALIDFIDWVGRQANADHQAELVINGDIVDFLADDDPDGAQSWIADEAAACARLDTIAKHTCGEDERSVFGALGDMVARGCQLTLLLGNHDVELSLPAVRRHLMQLLGGERAGVRFIYDGEAYLTDRVLIEHGNRYDRWNRIDYNALREERSVRSRGQVPAAPHFSPPAGTRMVVEVINKIKRDYRFIDLLKPETGAALPLLLALEPSLGKFFDALIKAQLARPLLAAGGVGTDGQPGKTGYLGMETMPALAEVLTQELGHQAAALFRDLSTPGQAAAAPPPDFMSVRGDTMQGRGRAAAAATAAARAVQTAADGLAALVQRGVAAVSDLRQRQLHAALRRTAASDTAFDTGMEAENYLIPARTLIAGGAIDVVVNGHTHMPKKILLDQPGRACWYLNTGTWCDVLRLPDIAPDFADARAPLQQFLEALRNNDLSAHVQRYLSWVEVTIAPGSAPQPALYSWCGAGRERCPPLTNYPPTAAQYWGE